MIHHMKHIGVYIWYTKYAALVGSICDIDLGANVAQYQ